MLPCQTVCLVDAGVVRLEVELQGLSGKSTASVRVIQVNTTTPGTSRRKWLLEGVDEVNLILDAENGVTVDKVE